VNQQIFSPKGTTLNDLERDKDGNFFKTFPRDKQKLSGGRRVVTFVGKFADWKRLDAVLYAATHYEETFPDLCTVIVGSGPQEDVDKYYGMAANLGLKRTVFVGPQQQPALADLYSMSEVGMFPSYKEPFGMVFIECMACGTPTIGCKSGGPTEFVTDKVGELINEETDWQTEAGMKRLGKRLSTTLIDALNADWKGKSKGPHCVPFVKENYSTLHQCEQMLETMVRASAEPISPSSRQKQLEQ